MITQSLFLLRSSTPLRVATSSVWRKDAVLAGGADPGDIVATHRSQAECPEAVMLQATTVAHLASGAAHGVTAATRRSTEGIPTGRGIKSDSGGFRVALLLLGQRWCALHFEDARNLDRLHP
jgi:hypothetical protein